jgi:hypothetical protein
MTATLTGCRPDKPRQINWLLGRLYLQESAEGFRQERAAGHRDSGLEQTEYDDAEPVRSTTGLLAACQQNPPRTVQRISVIVRRGVVSRDRVRQLALALPEVVEQDHHGRPSFRVAGRILATLWDQEHANVMLDEAGIRTAVEAHPGACGEFWWGKRLRATQVDLGRADEQLIRELLADAWEQKAPARLLRNRIAGATGAPSPIPTRCDVSRVVARSSHQIPDRPPLRVEAGDRVKVGERDGEWPAFVFVTAPKGSGWIPERHLDRQGASAVVIQRYDTTELPTEENEELEVLQEDLASGWLWCRAESGREGWVPGRILSGLD